MKRILTALLFAVVDIVCFLQGGIILTYALLHISYKSEIARGEGLTSIAVNGYYYYSEQYIKVALIGLGLLIVGLLMRSWRKSFHHEND